MVSRGRGRGTRGTTVPASRHDDSSRRGEKGASGNDGASRRGWGGTRGTMVTRGDGEEGIGARRCLEAGVERASGHDGASRRGWDTVNPSMHVGTPVTNSRQKLLQGFHSSPRVVQMYPMFYQFDFGWSMPFGRMVYKVLIKKGNVVGVSKVKSNLVAEGVQLVKNLNVGGNIRKTMPTCSKMLMSSSFKCWTGSMTKGGKQVWQSKDMVWALLL
ncbi:hypothetical protein KY290_013831 [Solanum tuberosum]|uniref:Uncharacterized protein n=1 Tax=Solanum tuberosum TaxID=4113 RepID=A0ABQ7VNI2_SOLTU|nr:hypothetical protein KY289_015551 [Solanum tuberosum]KAH0769850.1 hypothetical protein KY290_013831 [Solanum tuberosum]